MATSEAFAPAKINLTLHVTGRRADGYHLLDSLVVFADVGDHVSVRPAHRTRLRVSGPMAAGVPTDSRNLAVRAARLAGVSADISLEKHLPAAAGIGGGSSDAAAVLRALGWPPDRDPGAVSALGADVPVCLLARSARMSGIGEAVVPLEGFPTLPAVLINPGVSVSTPEVFRALVSKDGRAMPEVPLFSGVVECADWLRSCRNDLEPPARALVPEIDTVLKALDHSGALLSRMSGSGATCFGVYPSMADAREASAVIGAAMPHWWVRSTVLGPKA